MRNNRGQFFAFYLVFITLFMCGAVIGLYVIQDGKLEASLVSPVSVLETRDNLAVFEAKEVLLIKSCSKNSAYAFDTEEFLTDFRDCFLSGIEGDSEMMDFLLENLSVGGSDVVIDDKRNFIQEGVYPKGDSEFIEGKFLFHRADIEKRKILAAEDRTRSNFPVDFNFKFGRTYLISRIGEEFKVEIVK